MKNSNKKLTKIPEALFHLPDGISIQHSKVSGYGVFTKKPFQKGEVVYRANSVILKPQEASRLISFKISSHSEEITHKVEIHGLLINQEWHYYGFDSCMNHACEPNLSVYDLDRTTFVTIATRDIQAGEELLCDYNQWPLPYTLLCTCGSLNCKGVISGTLEEDLIEISKTVSQEPEIILVTS